jgi:site-specific recombinase XerD
MQRGWLVANPAFVAEPPSANARPIRPPSPTDVRRLLAAARAVDPDLACLLFLAAVAGARRGELCGLRWCDIDPAAGQLDIVRTVIIVDGACLEAPTKTRQSRRIALDDAVCESLAAHRHRAERRAAAAGVDLAREGFVFSRDPDSRRPWRPDAVTRAFDRVRRRAGLAGVRLHDVRHFTATALLSSGVDLRTVAGRLGHSKASTTPNVYAAFDPTADRLAAQAITRLLVPTESRGRATPGPGDDSWRGRADGPRPGALASARVREVLPIGEARARLSQIATLFDHKGATASPVVFGSHRRPQGVILAWELWQTIEDRLDTAAASRGYTRTSTASLTAT